MSKIINLFDNFINKIIYISNKAENFKTNTLECLSLLLFTIFHFGIMFFHEPWFDEAQAWQISKCASYFDILFKIPHFEGHLPLWHIILSFFSKNNFPYELSLSIITWSFSIFAMYLLVFKSPFPKIIRILLPFTYFFFYEFGIVARPYCMMLLAFCILAITFKNQISNPYKYLLSLFFLSLCSAFGLMISGILCLIFLFRKAKHGIKENRKIILSSFILLFFFFLLVLMIFPDKNVYALHMEESNTFLQRVLFFYTTLFADMFFASFMNTLILFEGILTPSFFIFPAIISIPLFLGLILYFKVKNALSEFLIPFILISVVFSKLYFSMHHEGIILCFILSLVWATYDKKSSFKGVVFLEKNIENIKKAIVFIITVIMCVSLYWSIKSSILDIVFDYSSGRSLAHFIKENHLENYKLYSQLGSESSFVNGQGIIISPYFNKNIFYNFKNKSEEENYVLFKTETNTEREKVIQSIKQKDLPDFFVGKLDLDSVFGNGTNNKYILVFSKPFGMIKKGFNSVNNSMYIYARRDIAQKLNLKEVDIDINSTQLSLKHLVSYITFRIICNQKKGNL